MSSSPADPKEFIQRYFPQLSAPEAEQLEKMVGELGASPEELAELSTLVEQMEKLFSSDQLPEGFAEILNQTMGEEMEGDDDLLGASAEDLAASFASMVAEMPGDLRAQMGDAFKELGLPNLDSLVAEATSLQGEGSAPQREAAPAVVDVESDFLSPLKSH